MADLYTKEIERDNSDIADGMRYLFDYDCSLHQNLFQQSDDALVQLGDQD